MDTVTQLLNAQNTADECAAYASLLRQCASSDQLVLLMAAQPPASSLSDSEVAHQPPLLSSMLEELLLCFILRAFAKAPSAQITACLKNDVGGGFVARWSPHDVPGGGELASHLTSLKRYYFTWTCRALPDDNASRYVVC